MKKSALGILKTKWRKKPGLKNYAKRMTLIALVHTAGPEPSGPFVTTLVVAPVHEGLEIDGFVPVVLLLHHTIWTVHVKSFSRALNLHTY